MSARLSDARQEAEIVRRLFVRALSALGELDRRAMLDQFERFDQETAQLTQSRPKIKPRPLRHWCECGHPIDAHTPETGCGACACRVGAA